MKAVILAAGEGRRLRPLTEKIPKVLLPINGKPLLEYWLDNCERHGVGEVLVNGHYMADLLEEYLKAARGRYSLRIQYVHEDKLLGTGGTVKKNFYFVKDEEFFFLCHGDNFTDVDISDFVRFHRERESELSVALFKTTVPEQCGIVEEMDEDGTIIKFTEKPAIPKSYTASAAIFLMSPTVIDSFPDEEVIDFSGTVLPLYQGRMFGYMMKGFNVDIGTPENYRLANEIITER